MLSVAECTVGFNLRFIVNGFPRVIFFHQFVMFSAAHDGLRSQ